MNRILLLPITLPLRAAALQLRIARAAAEWALDVSRELAEAAPWNAAGDERAASAEPPPPRPAAPRVPDAAEPERQARRRAAVQRTRAQAQPDPPPAPAAPSAAPVAEEPPRPRPRRAARKATARRPARERASGPTRGEVAAIREAQREAEGEAAAASVGPAAGAGPEIHVEPPWEGYDAMALDAVLARLEAADETTVAAVRLYESQNESRQAILLATENG